MLPKMLGMDTKDKREAIDNRYVLSSSKNSKEGGTEHLPSIKLGYTLSQRTAT